MSSITFKDEAWTIKTQPTHKVIAARGRHMEVVGYFIASRTDEIDLSMEVFAAEYSDHYDRLMAVTLSEAVVRKDPSVVIARVIDSVRKAS